MNNIAGIIEICPLVPITTVRLFGNIVLTGEGRFINVYEIQNDKSEYIFHHKIFQYYTIHGIQQNELMSLEMCIFGGCCIKTVCFNTRWQITKYSKEKLLHHWILDVKFNNKILICFLNNNSISILDLQSLEIINTIVTSEQCNLYSGFIHYDNVYENYVIMSGTFFNQVLIWSFKSELSQSFKNLEVNICHRLSEHKGIITSIFYHKKNNQILTSSDDRSLQLWQIRFTGDKADWVSAKFDFLISLFGHSSRIWKAIITTDYLISAGEDACCLIWNYNGRIVKKLRGHKGKNIWSLDINKEEDRLVTGGGDGSIRIWNLNRKITNLKDNFKIVKDLENEPRQVFCLQYNLLLIITLSGQFILEDVYENKNKIILTDANFLSYCSVGTNKKENLIAIGNIYGLLKILVFKGMELVKSVNEKVFDGKIFSIIFPQNNQILLTGPEGKLELLEIVNNESIMSILKFKNFILPNCKQRWVTCADIYDNLLICGGRHGSIYVYDLEGTNVNPIFMIEKLHGINGVTFIKAYDGQIFTCGRDGYVNTFEIDSKKIILVQSTAIFKSFEWLTNILFIKEEIYVLGFLSNKFVAYNLSCGEFTFELECGGGHRAWDYIIISSENKICFQFVFIKKKFVVACSQEFLPYQTIVKNSFGGSTLKSIHQICASNPNNDNYCTFLSCGEDGYLNLSIGSNFESNKIYHIHILSSFSIKTVSSNLRTLSFISNADSCNMNQMRSGIIICGGGGNIFKILSLKWRLAFPAEESTSSEFVQSHEEIPSTPHLCANILSNEEISKDYDINRFDFLDFKPYITPVLTYDMNKKLFRKKKPWKELEEVDEPEARCMCIDSFHCCNGNVAIVVATSMGIIRLFMFDTMKNLCELIWNSEGRSYCYTKVKHLKHTSPINHILEQRTSLQESSNITRDIISNANDLQKSETDTYSLRYLETDIIEHHNTDLATKKATNLSFKQDSHDVVVDKDKVSVSENTCSFMNRDFLCAAGTDGGIIIWDVTHVIAGYNQSSNNSRYIMKSCVKTQNIISNCDLVENESKPWMEWHAHQSGINAFDFVHLLDNRFLILTGGDDNALSLFLIDISQKIIISTNTNQFSHAAQITGLQFFNKMFFVSVSIDQRLIVWEIVDFESLNICARFSSMVDVADISDISTTSIQLKDGTSAYLVTVVGMGQQSFVVTLPLH